MRYKVAGQNAPEPFILVMLIRSVVQLLLHYITSYYILLITRSVFTFHSVTHRGQSGKKRDRGVLFIVFSLFAGYHRNVI